MSATPFAILNTGLVTPVGLDAPTSCAAIRAKLTNPSETRFIDSGGEWIMAHQVALEQPWRGLAKLAAMAALVIEEALQGTSKDEWAGIPLVLCVAETDRPGRVDGLDDRLLRDIQAKLGATFAPHSAIVPRGRVGVAVALAQARSLLEQGKASRVLIAAADSLLTWPTLGHYERGDRLLTPRNANGFMPGEGAGALLVGKAAGAAGEVLCTGIGFARENATIDSGAPLRADGLSSAIKAALAEAGIAMHDLDYRITDVSGEQYYFKEAALALSRTLRKRKAEFDLWHPAECTGEQGAAAGVTVIATAAAACRKGYARGPGILAHMSNDAGQRAALSLQFRGAA